MLTPSPSEPPRAAFSFAWGLTAVLLVAFVLVGGTVQALHVPYGIWFTELFLFFGLTWMALRLTGRHPLHHPGLGVPGGQALGLAFLAGVVNYFAWVIPLQVAAQALFKGIGAEELIEFFSGAKLFERQRPVDLAVILAGVTLAAPLCEEYFFRGVLLRGSLHSGTRASFALFSTAVVFSVFHLDPVGFAARLQLGLLFGWLYWKTGSLWPAILAHAANNGTSAGLYFIATQLASPGSGAQEPPLWAMPLLLLIAGGPLYLILRWFDRSGPMLQGGDALGPRGLRPKELGIWLGGAVLSAALLVVADRRTLAVNFTDLTLPARPARKADPEPWRSQFDALEQLREEVRSGTRPLSDYRAARERWAALVKGEDDAAPELLAPVPILPKE